MKKFVCPVCGYVHEGDTAPEKCPVCNNMIKKIKINGRGTYYCENCQK